MPYGVKYNEKFKSLMWFNREYNDLELDYPTDSFLYHNQQLQKKFWFYRDGSKPLSTKIAWNAYKKTVEQFKDFTAVGSTKGTVSVNQILECLKERYNF